MWAFVVSWRDYTGGADLHLGVIIMTVNGPKLNGEPVRTIVWSDYI